MQPLTFNGLRRILCVGAHSDDIEIGCGATLLRLTEEHPNLEVTWVVFSAPDERAAEAQASAEAFLRRAGKAHIVLKTFKVSFFPFQGEEIKEFFETLKDFRPDLVFTHYRDDRHQDHRVLSDLAWNTFRSHVILEYEIPKYDGDFGSPNVFVPVSRTQLNRQNAIAAEALSVAVEQALVHRRAVHGDPTDSRDGMRFTDPVRRGVLQPEAVARLTTTAGRGAGS